MYNSEKHPKKLLELMSIGKLDCEIFTELDISKTTFYRWIREYPDFKEAYEKGLPKCETESIIKPLKKMIETKNEKGYKALAHLARNKFGHDQSDNKTINNTQININQMNVVKNLEDYERLQLEVKEKLLELNITDLPVLDILPIEKDS